MSIRSTLRRAWRAGWQNYTTRVTRTNFPHPRRDRRQWWRDEFQEGKVKKGFSIKMRRMMRVINRRYFRKEVPPRICRAEIAVHGYKRGMFSKPKQGV